MTPTTAGLTWPADLIGELERQHEIVSALGALAERQADLITGAKTDALLELLSERQRLIDRFTRTQETLGHLTIDLDERIKAVSDADRTQIQTLIQTIGASLESVMARDAQDQATLASSRDRTKNELAGLDSANRARQAYRSTGAMNNRFADERG